MEHGDKSILQVNMFGGLAITYEGKNISIGKNKTAKYVQLLEIVWLSGEAGIQKEQLTSILYDREEQSNLSNSFNNLIYQLHKQIKKSGLPDHDYVVNRDGIFFTDDSIEIDSDVLRFVRYIEQARAAEDEADVISFYRAAFDEYKAEVLPELATQEWLIIKSVQYQKMYAEAVVALGASNDLLECYDKMSRQITNTPGKILQIRDGILEHRGAVAGVEDGAYDCSFPSFIDAYHILSRNMERSGQSVYMMLLNIVDYEGKRITNVSKLETRAKLLQEAITLTLRQGDTFCKYSASQFLLLLVGTNKESCKTVYRRLLNKFKLLAGPRTELEYSVVSLADLPDRLAEAK